MSHQSSAAVALVLGLLFFAAMQAFRSNLAETRPATILGGFLGSNIFLFLLTAVSNFEMDIFGSTFQTKLFPEVVICLLVALGASALVHRVCITTCLLFSLALLYCMNKISNTTYAPPTTTVSSAPTKKKK